MYTWALVYAGRGGGWVGGRGGRATYDGAGGKAPTINSPGRGSHTRERGAWGRGDRGKQAGGRGAQAAAAKQSMPPPLVIPSDCPSLSSHGVPSGSGRPCSICMCVRVGVGGCRLRGGSIDHHEQYTNEQKPKCRGKGEGEGSSHTAAQVSGTGGWESGGGRRRRQRQKEGPRAGAETKRRSEARVANGAGSNTPKEQLHMDETKGVLFSRLVFFVFLLCTLARPRGGFPSPCFSRVLLLAFRLAITAYAIHAPTDCSGFDILRLCFLEMDEMKRDNTRTPIEIIHK